MGSKLKLEFDGLDNVIQKLTKLGSNVKGTAEKALKESHKIVTDKAKKAIQPHHLTGATEKSIYSPPEVNWAGNIASVPVGFSIRNGGLAHIFLMYGTPRIKKDQKLYNAFFSKATKDEIKTIQEDIFYDELRRLNG